MRLYSVLSRLQSYSLFSTDDLIIRNQQIEIMIRKINLQKSYR